MWKLVRFNVYDLLKTIDEMVVKVVIDVAKLIKIIIRIKYIK